MAKAAPSCKAALKQASILWPKRRTSSDGIIGDKAHQSRVSDHNPGKAGYAHAWDLSHDPANGCDCDRIARNLAASRDPRIKYIIRRKKIWNPARGWHDYTGKDHNLHMHVSVWDTKSACEDTTPWPLRPISTLTKYVCVVPCGARIKPLLLSPRYPNAKFLAGSVYADAGKRSGKWTLLYIKNASGKQLTAWADLTNFRRL